MNFLAHLYLSGDFSDLMIGNFMGDFVKGKPASSLSAPLVQGIELHRRIDTFTDTHAIVKESKRRLYPVYHKFAAVIVDLFYDHFLAARWDTYASIPLPDFASRVYQFMTHHRHWLPVALRQMLTYMQRQNWLVSYAQPTGIAQALAGMARRTSFQSNMERAVHELKTDYALYETEFSRYFPELIQFVNAWKNARNIPVHSPYYLTNQG